MSRSVLVVGGGFKGMISAYLLREQGFEVTLLEKAPFLGGIMHSRNWKDYIVDNGVHLFDSIPKPLGEIISKVMDGKVFNVDFNYASAYQKVTTAGLAIPDFTAIDDEKKKQILFELAQQLTHTPSATPVSLYQHFQERYGNSAADLMNESFSFIYRISADAVEPNCINQTAFHRLKFLPDDVAIELKKHPVLDDRLAAMRVNLGKVDDLISMYPGERGMLGFCEKMTQVLSEMGVNVLTGTAIETMDLSRDGVICTLTNGDSIKADHLWWAGLFSQLAQTWKGDGRLEELLHGTPMVLYYFEVKQEFVEDYTYFHQFSAGQRVFRPAAAGNYGQQVTPDGATFITVECPCEKDGDLWTSPESFAEEVWRECIDMGILAPNTPNFLDFHFVKAPVTHRYAKCGYEAIAQKIEGDIEALSGSLIVPSRNAFTRREIFLTVEESVREFVEGNG